jgi:hypothetical protein
VSGQAAPTATITLQWPGRAQERSRTSPARTPRVARLLALGHNIERRIRTGELQDLAHASRVLGLTRARVTQIVNLTLLAPALQAEIVSSAPLAAGREPITERKLRAILAQPLWGDRGTATAQVWRPDLAGPRSPHGRRTFLAP